MQPDEYTLWDRLKDYAAITVIICWFLGAGLLCSLFRLICSLKRLVSRKQAREWCKLTCSRGSECGQCPCERPVDCRMGKWK